MRLAVSVKVFVMFSVLTVLSFAIALLVLTGNKELSKSRTDLASVRELQLQLKNLQLLQSDLVFRKDNTDDEAVVELFQRLHGLADKTRFLTSRFGSDLTSMRDNMFDQLEYFRQAYIELIDLYQRDVFHPRAIGELFRIMKLRTLGLSQELRATTTTQLNDLLILVMDVHRLKDPQIIPQMRDIQASIAGSIDDVDILANLAKLIDSAEENYRNSLAIKDSESFLADSATTFIKIADVSIFQISKHIDDRQKRLFITIISLSISICVVILLFWFETSRYLKKFLHALNTSVQSIRSGNYNFEMPEVDNDELGDQVHSVKEVAEQISDNLTRLTESETKFRKLVENVSEWIWAVDRDGVVTYTSPRCADIAALEEQQLVGHSVLEFLVSRHYGGAQHLYNLLKMKEPFTNFIHKFGDENRQLVLETSGRPLYDSEENYSGFQLISRDLTERQRVEEELKMISQSQQLHNKILGLAIKDLKLNDILDRFLAYMLESSWLGVEQTGAIFLIDEASQTLQLATHRGLDENLQKSCAVLPMGMCLCGRAAQSGKVVFADCVDERHEIDYIGMHMHGHYCVPIHSGDGKVIGVWNLYIRHGMRRDHHIESLLVNVSTVLGAIIQRKRAEVAL